MSDIDPELLYEVISLITEKKWYDYIPLFLVSATPLLAVAMSYFYFNKQHLQNVKDRIIEKEIERLYDAADLFFEYSDAIGLFISMTEIKSQYLLDKKGVPESVNTKAINSTEAVFNSFNSVHKSYFLLRSLGENDVASKVEQYREDTIEFRKEIVDIAKWKSGDDLPSNLGSELVSKIEDKKMFFITERNDCLDSIAQCKRRLKIDKPIVNE